MAFRGGFRRRHVFLFLVQIIPRTQERAFSENHILRILLGACRPGPPLTAFWIYGERHWLPNFCRGASPHPQFVWLPDRQTDKMCK